MTFIESDDSPGLWRIESIVCDGKAYPSSKLDPTDFFSGSCGELGDSDVDAYYQFRMGMICYETYIAQLKAKASVTLTSSFDLFTTR